MKSLFGADRGSQAATIGSLGANGAQVLTRLSAFLLFCVGIQITLSGTTGALRSALQAVHQ